MYKERARIKEFRSLLALGVAAIGLSTLLLSAGPARGQEDTLAPAGEIVPYAQDIVPEEYIIMMPEGSVAASSAEELQEILHLHGAQILADLPIINGASIKASPDVIRELQTLYPDLYIETNKYVTPPDTIGEPNSEVDSWGLDRIDQPNLPLDGEYSVIGGAGDGVVVYILDSGIDPDHPDLPNATQVANFTGDGIEEDCNGHGTHVAGIVGSSSLGVAPNVTIEAVKILSCGNRGDVSGIVEALNYTAERHIERGGPAVVNLSIAVIGGSLPMDTAVVNLRNKDITVAVASGNRAGDACNDSPSRLGRRDGIITVASSTPHDAVAPTSSWSPCVDIYAPGDGIYAPDLDGGYSLKFGTSMAAPHVAGLAALHLQDDPTATPKDVEEAIVDAAELRITNNPTDTVNLLLNIGGVRPDVAWQIQDPTSTAVVFENPVWGDDTQLSIRVPTKNITGSNQINWGSEEPGDAVWDCRMNGEMASCNAVVDHSTPLSSTTTLTLTREPADHTTVDLSAHWDVSKTIRITDTHHTAYEDIITAQVGEDRIYIPIVQKAR